MDKLKSIQPVIFVILICLSIFQFMQIKELREEIANMDYKVDHLESEAKDHEYKIDRIQKTLGEMDDIFRDQEKRISTIERDNLFRY